MKVKTRIIFSVMGIITWLAGTNAFVPAVHAAAPHSNPGSVLSAGSDDVDHDGLTSRQEKACGTNPRKADSDNNGIRDGADDRDHDGLSNMAEFQHGTKCRSSDTDRDGTSDGQEVRQGRDPRKQDDTPHPEDHP